LGVSESRVIPPSHANFMAKHFEMIFGGNYFESFIVKSLKHWIAVPLGVGYSVV
jgi:hypothetical protein